MMNSSLRFNNHLTEEQLIKCLDGELGKRDRAGAERHIEACWGCRHKLDQFRQAMDRFVEFDSALADDSAATPPRDWGGFSGGLRNVAASSVLQRPARSPMTLRRAGVLAPAVVVSVCFVALWLAPASTVSAKEIYDRSAASEQALLKSAGNPLVIQQVRVESAQRTALWSVWRAPVLGRVRQSWDARNDSHLRTEVEQLYARHGMDFSQPLSVSNHSKWRRSLGKGDDSVRRDGDMLHVVTRNQGRAAAGQIVEARLVVRATDWHPVEASFTVSDPGGEKQYRMVEASYRVEPINSESARIFEPTPLIEPAPVVFESTVLPPGPEPVAMLTPIPVAYATETEIQALSLLHEMGADREESARVDRDGDVVRATAYAADEERKVQIERRLSVVPSLAVTVHLPSDRQPGQVGDPAPLRGTTTMPPLFLRALTEQTGSPAVANGLVSRQMNLLWKLTVELGAVEDLARRFPEESQSELATSARQWLDALALDHLKMASQAWSGLEEASSVFLAALRVPVVTSVPLNPQACGEWRHRSVPSAEAARRMRELYVRAFTVSAGAPNDQVSEELIRNEVAALRAELAQAFPEACS